MTKGIRNWLTGNHEDQKMEKDDKQDRLPASDEELSPVVDETVLQNLGRATSLSTLSKILETYLQGGQERIPKMQLCLEKCDLDALAFEAHSLKGASGSCGALRLKSEVTQLEAAAEAADLKTATAVMERLLVTWEKTEIDLKVYLSKLPVE